MQFKTKKILTGVQQKVSTKTNKPYTLLTFLNENGSTFNSMSDVIPQGLKQLDNCEVEFEVTFYNNNVSGLKTLSICKA